MIEEDELRLFLLNAAVVHGGVREAATPAFSTAHRALQPADDTSGELKPYISQFRQANRDAAAGMSVWYVLFHMLENEIRQFIDETLADKSADWWNDCVPDPVKAEVGSNRQRELDIGVVPRSESPLDYTTFGQLGDIMRANWDVFGGVLSSQKAMTRVMAMLNALRGPIAHCGVLAPDEIDRLKLSVKDWFRLLAGPQ